jgi:hypothetical protein
MQNETPTKQGSRLTFRRTVFTPPLTANDFACGDRIASQLSSLHRPYSTFPKKRFAIFTSHAAAAY